MYRAVTGWLKLLMVFAVLEYEMGRKNRVVPSSAVAETKPDVVSEYCTWISVTNCDESARHCVTTPWTRKLLPRSICIQSPTVEVQTAPLPAAQHSDESIIDLSWYHKST